MTAEYAKICFRCKVEKPRSEFNIARRNKDGLYSYCRSCQQLVKRQDYRNNYESYRKRASKNGGHNRDRARETVYSYLKTHPCIDCGEFDILVLQFDHVRGIKSNNMATLISRGASDQIIYEEIQKCEVRCANCHARKTAKQFDWKILEGIRTV